MIRFQICIFDILNTAKQKTLHISTSCDSLSNLYLWHIKYSSAAMYNLSGQVVIRFQICIFDILNTAILIEKLGRISCDSLSNLYLWHIKYSLFTSTSTLHPVVIRFQICIFDILNTAMLIKIMLTNMLWFAFKFVSLTY